jgi:tetratricopeptide (TPR) repeat protein
MKRPRARGWEDLPGCACVARRSSLAALVFLGSLLFQVDLTHGESAVESVVQVSHRDGDAETLRQLAHGLSETGDVAGAEAVLLRGLKREPHSASAQRDLAKLYLETNRPAEALPLLEQALSRAPEDLQIRDALSYALYQAGDAVGSLEVSNRGEPLGPAHAEALVEAARFYTEGGHPEAAARALAKAHELAPGSPSVSKALLQHSAMNARGTEALPERRNPPTPVALVLAALAAIVVLRILVLFRRGRGDPSVTIDDPRERKSSLHGRVSRRQGLPSRRPASS